MRQCNSCEKRSCTVIRAARKAKLSDEEMQSIMSKSCNVSVPPEPWTQPLVLHALATHPQGVHDVLQSQEMFFQEMRDEPYFRILMREMR